mgnify:CR=1 FL=1
MTSDEVKELKALLEAEISPLKEDMRLVKGQLSEVNDKLDTHTTSLVVIEGTLKGYADMYKVNKEKSEGLNERVTVIEDHLGLASQK